MISDFKKACILQISRVGAIIKKCPNASGAQSKLDVEKWAHFMGTLWCLKRMYSKKRYSFLLLKRTVTNLFKLDQIIDLTTSRRTRYFHRSINNIISPFSRLYLPRCLRDLACSDFYHSDRRTTQGYDIRLIKVHR